MTKGKQLTITETLRKQESEFASLLRSSGTDIKKFMNNALMAVNEKPEIKRGEVSTRSVFAVCSRAANDGVVLDGKEAAIVIGWNDKTKSKEAQYRLMSGGVMKMIRRSPEISFIACQVVYENDICEINFVTDEIPVTHTINLKMARGEPIGAYVVAKLASGEWTSPEYMSKAEIESVRDNYSAKNKDGKIVSPMWNKSPGEAWRKTVLHRAKKRLPIGDREEQVLRQDEADEVGGEIIDNTTGEVTSAEPPKKRQTRAAQAVKDAVKGDAEPKSDVLDAEFTEVEDDGLDPEVTEPAAIAEEEIPM
ncbi:recombinase RecT [Rhodopila sp.]|uniref:recombinase RecT n=1 Tax=Rhodopila sp. TaxID=2480087 RepID=UPI003D144C2B